MKLLVFSAVLLLAAVYADGNGQRQEGFIPGVLKHLRLRPFSVPDDDLEGLSKVEIKQLRNRPIKSASQVNANEPEKPVGANTLGINRRPPVSNDNAEEHKGFIPGALKHLRLRPFSVPDDDLEGLSKTDIKQLRNRPDNNGEHNAEEPEKPIGANTLGINRRPPVSNDNAKEHNGFIPGALKHLRLRPFSVPDDDLEGLSKTEIKQLRNRPFKSGEHGNTDEPEKPIGANTLGKNRHPPVSNDNAEEHKGFIPAALRHLRLRPFSVPDDDLEGLSKTEIKQLRNRPFKSGAKDNVDEPEQPIGANTLGINRRRPLDGNAVLQKPVPKCYDQENKDVLQCFENYFKNFGLELVDGKLPSLWDIYKHTMNNKNYEENKRMFDDFRECYHRTPETCYHADNLKKIASQPDQADGLAMYFTVAEYVYQSEQYKSAVECYVRNSEMPDLPTEGMDDAEVEKKCKALSTQILESLSRVEKQCASDDRAKIEELLCKLLRRISLGQTCPTLISDLGLHD